MRRTALCSIAVLALGSARVLLAQGQPGVVGQWLFRNEQTEVRAEFRADGRYTRSIRSPGENGTVSGIYRLAGGYLELRPDGGNEVVRLRCRLVDANTLEITDDQGAGLRLARQAAPQPPGPSTSPMVPLPGWPQPAAPQAADMPIEVRPPLPLQPSPSGHIILTKYVPIPVDTPIMKGPIYIPKLFVMTGDGSAAAPFLAPPDFTSFKQARWSPNYDRLAFTSDYRNTLSACFEDIFVVGADGTGFRRVTGNELVGAAPAGYAALEGRIRDNVTNMKMEADPGGQTTELGMAIHHQRINVTAQGADGRIYHPDPPQEVDVEIVDPITGEKRKVKSGETEKQKERQYRFRIPRCAAGKVWVKVWMDKWIGNLVVVDLKADVVNDVGDLPLSQFNLLASQPSLTPDGQFVVGLGSMASFAKTGSKGYDPAGTEPPQSSTTTGGADHICVYRVSDGQMVAMFSPTRAMGENAKDAAVSPDGQSIALAWGRFGGENLAVLPLREMLRGRPTPRVLVPSQSLPFETTLYGAGTPAWSPDGRTLAFARTLLKQHFISANIAVVNADGSGLRQLTNVGLNQLCCQPCFSPDGRRIVFTILTGKQGPIAIEHLIMRQFTADLYVINADGTGPARLTSDGVSCEPAWGR